MASVLRAVGGNIVQEVSQPSIAFARHNAGHPVGALALALGAADDDPEIRQELALDG